METLKECPFCGGNALLHPVTKKGRGGCDLFNWEIGCGSCGAKVPSCGDEAVRDDAGIRLTVDGRSGAIAAWNRRIEGRSDLTYEIERLRARLDQVGRERDAAHRDGVNYAIYETWKEADLPIETQDIRQDVNMTVDEKCAEFAKRIGGYVAILEVERDAAIGDLHQADDACVACKKRDGCTRMCASACFEWRGVPKEE